MARRKAQQDDAGSQEPAVATTGMAAPAAEPEAPQQPVSLVVEALPLPVGVIATSEVEAIPPKATGPARKYRVTENKHWLKGVNDKSSRVYEVGDIVEYVGEVTKKLVPVDETADEQETF